MPMEKVKAEIMAVIEPIIRATGNYLEDLTIQSAGKRRMITIIVDGDSHLNLDQVTVITKEISEVIENLQTLGDIPFTLEVTSPGIDRPLTLPRHWRKNLGRLVSISLLDGSEVKGRIGEATEVDAIIDESKISYSDIKKAVLEVEFK
jgi:ribosome maturation factor RimP